MDVGPARVGVICGRWISAQEGQDRTSTPTSHTLMIPNQPNASTACRFAADCASAATVTLCGEQSNSLARYAPVRGVLQWQTAPRDPQATHIFQQSCVDACLPAGAFCLLTFGQGHDGRYECYGWPVIKVRCDNGPLMVPWTLPWDGYLARYRRGTAQVPCMAPCTPPITAVWSDPFIACPKYPSCTFRVLSRCVDTSP